MNSPSSSRPPLTDSAPVGSQALQDAVRSGRYSGRLQHLLQEAAHLPAADWSASHHAAVKAAGVGVTHDTPATHGNPSLTTSPPTPSPTPTTPPWDLPVPSPHQSGGTVTSDGSHFIVTTPFTPAIQESLKRLGGRWDGTRQQWRLPATAAAGVRQLVTDHGWDIDATAAALEHSTTGPLLFDGTIDGLAGVPVSDLATVASKKDLADRLATFGITTVHDLLHHIPIRYLDRSTTAPINTLTVGDTVAFLATVKHLGTYDRVKKLIRVTVADTSGEVALTFFRAPWIGSRIRKGDLVTVHGKLDLWTGGGRRVLQMTNPLIDPLGDDPAMVLPVYPQSAKSRVTTWELHAAATEAIARIPTLTDPLPDDVITRHDLLPRKDAYLAVHRPTSLDHATQGRHRLVFDELLRMQLLLGVTKHATTSTATGHAHTLTGELTDAFLATLPFTFTSAQQRAVADITTDMQHPHPMHRLLQGDVGAGKSLVALVTALTAVEAGGQVAVMAPTEILARQLFTEFHDRTTGLTTPTGVPVTVEFLAGTTKVRAKKSVLTGLADGSVHIVVGTHALLTDTVQFRQLTTVIVDEQHRFGIEQRAILKTKGGGITPDMLVMTATPIPRTAAMTVYGDLDVSIVDELPPGRTPVATTWIRHTPDLDNPLFEPWPAVLDEIRHGHQVYIVAPLVEESEKLEAAAAVDVYQHLSTGALSTARLGLIHGQMKADEKDTTMAAFAAGNLDVLVATTVIEVGVNVPNTTIMVILDAPRFGLAQLHQLRGRVGRSSLPSQCFLLGEPASADGVERMRIMETTHSGFALAEHDLRLRGEGAILGTSAAQSGRSDLTVADLRTDAHLVPVVREEAHLLLASDPLLTRRPGLRAEITTALGVDAADWLTRS